MNWHFCNKIVLLQERVADICIQNLKTKLQLYLSMSQILGAAFCNLAKGISGYVKKFGKFLSSVKRCY